MDNPELLDGVVAFGAELEDVVVFNDEDLAGVMWCLSRLSSDWNSQC